MVNVLKLDVEKELENVQMVSVVVDTDIVEQRQNSVHLQDVKKNMVIVKKKKIEITVVNKKVVTITKRVKY